MHSRHLLLTFTFIYIAGVVAVSGQGSSSWQDVKQSVTNIFRSLGLPRAGEPCAVIGRDLNRCIAAKDGSIEEVPFLECDGIGGMEGVMVGGICNVKSWIVFIVLALFVAIPMALLGCICCFCCRCGRR